MIEYSTRPTAHYQLQHLPLDEGELLRVGVEIATLRHVLLARLYEQTARIRWIAETVARLRDERAAALAREATLRAALEYYATPDPAGSLARRALADAGPAPGTAPAEGGTL